MDQGPSHRLRLGEHVTVEIWEGTMHLRTTFSDGRTLEAGPNFDAASVARAAALGYGELYTSPWQMSKEHEILHNLLAILAGKPWSPTLHDQAAPPGEPRIVERSVQHDEECEVLAVQAYLHTDRRDVWLERVCSTLGLGPEALAEVLAERMYG